MRTRTALPTGTIAALAIAPIVLSTPANADPSNMHTNSITVACTDGSEFVLRTLGIAALQSPGLLADSTSVFVPVAMGELHITVTDSAGNLLDEITQPQVVLRGSSGHHADLLACDFEFTDIEDVPGLGEITARVESAVQGFTTPRR